MADSDTIDGFIIAQIGPAPPVYDPGGLTTGVDDSMVRTPDLWCTVGRSLLDHVRDLARDFEVADGGEASAHISEVLGREITVNGDRRRSVGHQGAETLTHAVGVAAQDVSLLRRLLITLCIRFASTPSWETAPARDMIEHVYTYVFLRED